MSDTEKENFKAEILNDFVKKWRPVVIAFFSVVGVAITATWWVAHNIATTSDTDKIMTNVEDIKKQLANMSKDYVTTDVAYNDRKVIHSRIDSLSDVVASGRGAVTAHRDKTGNVTFRPYVN